MSTILILRLWSMLSLLNYRMKVIVCDQTNNGTKHFFGQFYMEPPQTARHFCSHT